MKEEKLISDIFDLFMKKYKKLIKEGYSEDKALAFINEAMFVAFNDLMDL